MKKIILLLTFITSAFIATQAQTEISGYLDSDPSDGIGQTAVATFDLLSAVQACRSLVHDGKTDWYLPSGEEILLFGNGDSDTGTTPGCTGSNCNWLTNITWTRSVGSSAGNSVSCAFRHQSVAAAGYTFLGAGSADPYVVRCVR